MHERRKTTRNRSYFGGQIAFNGQRSLMDCLVRNISGDGAKLVFTQTATVPQEFVLSVHSKERTFRARVVWRRADEAGVASSSRGRNPLRSHSISRAACANARPRR